MPWRNIRISGNRGNVANRGVGSKFDFDSALATFTPSMAKRATSVFAASPIIQGKRDSTATSDFLSFPNTEIFDRFGTTFDLNQGTIVFWITPEWNGNDGLVHRIIGFQSRVAIHKEIGNLLVLYAGNAALCTVSVAGWVAGNTYCVIARWDTKNTIDGTNYGCISINDVHTFAGTSQTTPLAQTASYPVGSYTDYAYPGNEIVQGLTIYRRVLYDGAYGVDVGNGDELALIYNAGTGADPTTITGSWDVCFCLPTNATAGALATGVGNAWSHPHSSNLLTRGFLTDRYYGRTNQWGVVFDGTNTNINCGSGATLDDLADNAFTAECWIRANWAGTYQNCISKYTTGSGWYFRFNTNGTVLGIIICATANPVVQSSVNYQDGKWHHIAMTFDDAGDRIIRLYIDGKYQGASAAGVGAIVSDAANDLCLGSRPGIATERLNGTLGWCRLSNNKRYTDGVDFVPARTPPAIDANTVEQWNLNEGTDVTATAQVTTPANDGTITNGTWEQQWHDEGTPVMPRSVSGGANHLVNVGSGATIDDLHDNAFTVDGWFRTIPTTTTIQYLGYKGDTSTRGWYLRFSIPGGNLIGNVRCATTHATTISLARYDDGLWHYIKMTFDD